VTGGDGQDGGEPGVWVVDGAVGVLQEEEGDGEIADFGEADDLNGLGNCEDFDAFRVVADGIGDTEDLGNDGDIALDEFGEVMDGNGIGASGYFADDFDDLNDAGRLLVAEGGEDAADRAIGQVGFGAYVDHSLERRLTLGSG